MKAGRLCNLKKIVGSLSTCWWQARPSRLDRQIQQYRLIKYNRIWSTQIKKWGVHKTKNLRWWCLATFQSHVSESIFFIFFIEKLTPTHTSRCIVLLSSKRNGRSTNSSTCQIFKTIKRSKLVRYVGEWLAIIHSHAWRDIYSFQTFMRPERALWIRLICLWVWESTIVWLVWP